MIGICWLTWLTIGCLATMTVTQKSDDRLTDDSRDIVRIGHGVIFRFAGLITPSTQDYTYHFLFDLPSYTLNPGALRKISTDKPGSNMSVSVTAWMACLDSVQDLVVEKKGYAGSAIPCGHWFDMTKLLVDAIQTAYETMRDVNVTIMSLLPHSVVNISSQAKVKRYMSPFAFIGDIVSSITGIPSERQFLELAGAVKKLATFETSRVNTMSENEKGFSTLTKLVNEHVMSSARSLKGVLNEISETHAEFNKLSGDMQVGNRIIFKNLQVLSAMVQMNYRASSLLKGLMLLREGILSEAILPQRVLAAALSEVDGVLGKDTSVPLTIIHRHAIDYYRKSHFLYGAYKNKLLISLKIPLTSYKAPFKIYRPELIEHSIPEMPRAALRLKLGYEGIAVEVTPITVEGSSPLFAKISPTFMNEVLKGNKHATKLHIFEPASENLCTLHLLNGNATGIKESCRYDIVHNGLKPQLIHLGANKFYKVGGDPKYVVFQKAARNSDRLTASDFSCENCVLTVPRGASVRTSHFRIPAMSLSNELAAATGIIFKQHHVLSIPRLQRHVSDAELNSYCKNVLYEDPFVLDIPPLEIYRNPILAELTKDDEISTSLTKVEDDFDAKRKTMHTVGDALLLEMQESEIFTSEDTVLWWLPFVFCAMLLIFSCFNFYKIRIMAAAIAVTSFGNAKVNAETASIVRTIPPVDIRSPTTIVTMAATQPNVQVIFHENVQNYWMYVILVGIILVTSSCLVRSLYRKYCYRHVRAAVKSRVCLQISAGTSTLLIELMTIYALPQEIEIRCNEAIGDMNVIGFFLPEMLLAFNFQAVDMARGIVMARPRKISLGMLQAVAIRSVLARKFTCLMTIVHNGEISRVDISKCEKIQGKTLSAAAYRSRNAPVDSLFNIHQAVNDEGCVEIV